MITKQFKKPTTLLIALIGLVTLFAIVGWSPRSQANFGEIKNAFASAAPTNIHEMNDRVTSLNRKAWLTTSGDERAVRDLADEVFAQFGSADTNDALSVVKDRLVSSEVNYRRGGNGGISERKLVSALNKLTRQLRAPDFAKVTVAQLRYLRINLLAAYPSFISQSSDRQLGQSRLKPEMSPLEAAGLSMLLVTQKLSNEDFQVTPEEWAHKRYQKEIAKWKEQRNGRAAPGKTAAKGSAKIESTKGRELQQIFIDRGADMEALIDDMMTEIGISAQRRIKQ